MEKTQTNPLTQGHLMPVTLFYITIPHTETGQVMAKKLLEQKLIACANIFPAHMALYEWDGKLEENSEHVMILKTTPDKASEVQRQVQELHPYDCPCILQLSPTHSNQAFFDWVKKQTRG
jgi:periplasmic divalent cation tolerance protein